MIENLIVGVIVALAIGFSVYRVFIRPSCGCGDGCNNCASKKREQNQFSKKLENKSGDCCPSCHCGK